MAKLNLKAAPTFKAKVGVKVPGGELVQVEFTFKHRTKSERIEWVKSLEGKSDADFFMQMVEGWDLSEPFNRENVDLLLENYDGTALETFRVYLEQLTQAKLGN